ncbi:winged helix-turn-helix domain-containing protein [Anaerovibrio lipolyticus]|uniref:winged helix-turn-helix domain-containing protein n=1 Tax=Anaerovibrio lipolyticus TaxID=82374 RepID=UPI0026ED2252|nr:winged helix-turn-helix domain-containing protein [Anaerovibrio lipolyticus]MBE6105275.1 sigma-70 family RNA polymerase sigma factor [Anaerovibrio lipolyticus]
MKKYIYVNAAKEKFYVTDEEYREFYKEVDAKRKREQYHHRCYCPREFTWRCDADCDICEFHRNGDFCSLDKTDEDGFSLVENLSSDSDTEQIVADSLLLQELFAKLRELDPDADQILQLWQDNPKISAREIARQLGRKQRTFADQIKRYRIILEKIRSK